MQSTRETTWTLEPDGTRFESIVRTLRHGVCEVDLAGRVRYINPAGEQLLGYAAGELLGLSFYDVVHADPLEGDAEHALDCTLLRVIRGLPVGDAHDTFLRRNGAPILVELDGSQFTSGNLVSGSVIEFHDVTSRLLQDQRKDDFLAFASHELRSPLTVVSAMAQFLARHAATNPARFDEPSREAIDDLRREALRMVSLVDVFLDLARIDSGRLQVELDQVDLAAVLLDEAEAARVRAPHLEITTIADTPVPACTDSERVRQVLRTLLDNAATYAGARPQLALRLTPEHGLARIDVADDGPGIPLEDQPHIFDRMYRGHAASDHKGLGVGLFISAEIVRRLGGTISLTSTPGDGATFTVRLPLAPPR